MEICFGTGRKHCGNWRKCWLPALSPFPKMFSKAFLFRVNKSRDRVVEGFESTVTSSTSANQITKNS